MFCLLTVPFSGDGPVNLTTHIIVVPLAYCLLCLPVFVSQYITSSGHAQHIRLTESKSTWAQVCCTQWLCPLALIHVTHYVTNLDGNRYQLLIDQQCITQHPG